MYLVITIYIDFIKESEILSNNLSSDMLQKEEILIELDDLRMLGNLHESLVRLMSL